MSASLQGARKVILTSNTSWYLFNFRRGTIAALKSRGYEVVCLAPLDRWSEIIQSQLGARHVSLPLEGKSVSVLREIKSLFAVWRILRKERPGYVFNFTIKMNIYGGLACRALRIPFANNVSGLGTAFMHESWLFRRVRWLYGFVNRAAKRVFFQNQDDLNAFRATGLLQVANTVLLPGSGVNLKDFALCPLPEGGQFTFLLIGRLLGDKGIREYAQACRILKEHAFGLRCLLVGPTDASNRTAISEEEVRGWQAEGLLEYLGEVDDVRPFIRQAHVIVLPSYREGMPRTVLEAAAMGRPAIVADVPGCRQAVEPGVTGWLCEVRDSRALAAKMLEVSSLPRDQINMAGLNSRQRVEESFGEELVVQEYLACLQGKD